jgi:hypothetical protein
MGCLSCGRYPRRDHATQTLGRAGEESDGTLMTPDKAGQVEMSWEFLEEEGPLDPHASPACQSNTAFMRECLTEGGMRWEFFDDGILMDG